jgi:hypothetical protein
MNLFTKSTIKADVNKLKQIKTWVYQTLKINRETPISINQLQCHEPDCPPVETVIAIMNTPPKQYKIHKPLSQISEADIKKIQ